MVDSINRLKEEHSIVIKELDYFEKHLAKIGNNLDVVKKFTNLFDNKIYYLIKLEEKALFPYLEKYIGKDGPLFVMSHTHKKIEEGFEGLKDALSKQDIYKIRKSGEELAKVLRFHIEKEDSVILKEAEEKLDDKQISRFSGMFAKLIKKIA